MTHTNMGVLVAKRAAYSALIIGGIIGLFTLLSWWQNHTTSLDWRIWAFIGFWTVALIVDTYLFTVRNVETSTMISYDDDESGQERIHAILATMGYEQRSHTGNVLTYIATFYVGTMNRPVYVTLKPTYAQIEGPSFAVNRIENRIETLNYVDMHVGTGTAVPAGGSALDYGMQSGTGTTQSEVFTPKTA